MAGQDPPYAIHVSPRSTNRFGMVVIQRKAHDLVIVNPATEVELALDDIDEPLPSIEADGGFVARIHASQRSESDSAAWVQ